MNEVVVEWALEKSVECLAKHLTNFFRLVFIVDHHSHQYVVDPLLLSLVAKRKILGVDCLK